MQNLNIIAFTDFHGRQDAGRKARQLISREQPALIVVAGDLVNYDVQLAKQLLLDMAQGGRPIYFVPGNMDDRELGQWSGNELVRPLHGRREQINELCLIGLGGSPVGSFKSPFGFTEQDATRLLNNLVGNCHQDKTILVAHCPPKNTKIDHVASGEHIGSISVRKFVEKTQPLLVISGHVHEAQGVDKIGKTTLVNPGPAHHGHFARISLNDDVTVCFDRLA
jgi:hypothetical protein